MILRAKLTIKELCSSGSEVKITYMDEVKNSVGYKLPYNNKEFQVEITGDTTEAQVKCFTESVNEKLECMIEFLADSKLIF